MHYLQRDATDAELLDATGRNQAAHMALMARAGGGFAAASPGGSWAFIPEPTPEVLVALLEPPPQEARAHLDEVLAFARERGVARVGYWSLRRDGGALGAWLAGRGFRWGDRAHWMAADLRAVEGLGTPGDGRDLPPGQELAPWDRLTGWDIPELPALRPRMAPVREAMCRARPRRYWQIVFSEHGRPIGQVSLNASTGPLGVVGLSDAVFLETRRTRGPGLGRFLATYRFVQGLGARYVVTNSVHQARSLYAVAGFRPVGTGQTWWLPGDALGNAIPDAAMAVADAVGQGDVAALDALWSGARRRHLHETLPNGTSPLQLAASLGRQEVARWLLDHGAEPEVLALWDLGWKDEVAELLRADPGVVAQRRPRSGKTLLHGAVERGDPELARLLLDAGADPEARDHRFGGTPLDWAGHLRQPRVAAAIRGHPASAAGGR